MAHVNVFARVEGAGNPHSIGGRRAQDHVNGWFNTANHRGETALSIDARVVGNTDSKTRRKEGDDRKSIFTVELPEETNPDACEVRIEQHGYQMESLARIGAALCMVKAAGHAMDGETERAMSIMDVVTEVFDDSNNEIQGNVTLPGGVSMKAALAAYAILEKVRDGELTLN